MAVLRSLEAAVAAPGGPGADGTARILADSAAQAEQKVQRLGAVAGNMTGQPSSSLTTSNTSLTFTIEGDASDTNGLSEVLVIIREDLPGDPDGDGATCDRSDPLVNDDGDPTTGASDNADDTSIDVTANADGFSVDVTLSNTLDAGESGHDPQVVCFFIEAADNARNNQGDPEPNTSNQSATTTIDWN